MTEKCRVHIDQRVDKSIPRAVTVCMFDHNVSGSDGGSSSVISHLRHLDVAWSG